MKIEYLGKIKFNDDMYIDRYYCDENDSCIYIYDYEDFYTIIRRKNGSKVDDETLISPENIKFNNRKQYFEVKAIEFSNNETFYYLELKFDGYGDIFDIKVSIPSVYKAELNLGNYNLFDFEFDKTSIFGLINNMIDSLNIDPGKNEKIYKKELKKYGYTEY